MVTSKIVKMTAKMAAKLVGFRTELNEGEKGLSFVDANGTRKKFVMDNNKSNRPFKYGVMMGYRDQILKGEWAGMQNSGSTTGNGESWIIDKNGHVGSCAHRAIALILAQHERDRLASFPAGSPEADFLEAFQIPKELTIEANVVEGIDPAAADTLDTGKTRTFGDVVFRGTAFRDGKAINDSARRKLSSELAVATRLVYLRSKGYLVGNGPKVTFPELKEFLDQHPKIEDAVLHVFEEDNERSISLRISLGYAAANLYLMAYADQDWKAVHRKDEFKGKPRGWSTAEDFWTKFSQLSQQAIKAEDCPAIAALNQALTANSKSEAKLGRDALNLLVTRAWLCQTAVEGAGEWGTKAGLMKKLTLKVDGNDQLNLIRYGGLDVDRELLKEAGLIEEEMVAVRKQEAPAQSDTPAKAEKPVKKAPKMSPPAPPAVKAASTPPKAPPKKKELQSEPGTPPIALGTKVLVRQPNVPDYVGILESVDEAGNPIVEEGPNQRWEATWDQLTVIVG